ncbi:hypothetical protein [Streptomyces globosus]|uniref:hypothetical protein n=1 Tax=Streptomyces globosus TaxID=68209 RepID=UPI0031DAD741
MATEAGAAGATLAPPIQWCHWHVGSSQTARPIRFAGRRSGPPVLLYACAPCREQRHLDVRGDR